MLPSISWIIPDKYSLVLSKDLPAGMIKQERQNPLEIDTHKIKNKIKKNHIQANSIQPHRTTTA